MQKLVVITGPSGAGKTTISRHLLDAIPSLRQTVTATTRQPREGEQAGIDYHYLSTDEFKGWIESNDLLEYEEVYENTWYGTPKAELAKAFVNKFNPIVVLDVKGAAKVRDKFEGETFVIFVRPPSVEELERRLTARASDTPEKLEARTRKAAEELELADHFDAVVFNDDLTQAKRAAVRLVREFLRKRY